MRDFDRGERKDGGAHDEDGMPARALRLRGESYGGYATGKWADKTSQIPGCSGGIYYSSSSPGISSVYHHDAHHGAVDCWAEWAEEWQWMRFPESCAGSEGGGGE